MEDNQKQALLDTCKLVLDSNWRDTHTIPAEGLYPHQWLWDSCFIAIGLRHHNIEYAQKELRNLCKGQWNNGMLPHIIFGLHDKSHRDRKIWQSWRNPHAPEHIDTSGMTQPPMLAEAVVKIGELLTLRERRAWYLDLLPALIAHHRWLYNERDPHQEGLVLLIHPWESGLDNSPPWIEQMHTHNKPIWIQAVQKLKLDKVALLLRRDTQHVPPGQRLDTIDALHYYSVLQRLRRKNWDIDSILSRSHFAIEDVVFNSILIRANDHLYEISKTVGHVLPEDLCLNAERSRDSLEKLWDEQDKSYYARNFITHKPIKQRTIATLMPLYSGAVSADRAAVLVKMLHESRTFKALFPVPSVPFSSKYYKELGYWQGPTWLNTNWLIADGLERYGYANEAAHIRNTSLTLISKSGPYEYFSARSGKPAGAKNFSWSAALALDFINKY